MRRSMLRPALHPRAAVAAGAVVASLLLCGRAPAEILATLSVGEGWSLSTIQIDFSNGNGYVVEYRHDGTATGFSALLEIESLIPGFTLDFDETVFGPMVTGLGLFGDYEYGTGDLWPRVENYWHYWVKDSGEWSFASGGASARQLFDGSFDGWVFGLPAAPQDVPAPSALLLLALPALRCRRRAGDVAVG